MHYGEIDELKAVVQYMSWFEGFANRVAHYRAYENCFTPKQYHDLCYATNTYLYVEEKSMRLCLDTLLDWIAKGEAYNGAIVKIERNEFHHDFGLEFGFWYGSHDRPKTVYRHLYVPEHKRNFMNHDHIGHLFHFGAFNIVFLTKTRGRR